MSFLKKPCLSVAEISILLVGEKRMRQLNTDFRGIRKTTDVLSFESTIPVKGAGRSIVLGDVVICVPKAVNQARAAGSGLYEELYRLLIHGILHLAGFEHEGSAEKARIMEKKEKEMLDALKKMDGKR